jgi:hypothetical protein
VKAGVTVENTTWNGEEKRMEGQTIVIEREQQEREIAEGENETER